MNEAAVQWVEVGNDATRLVKIGYRPNRANTAVEWVLSVQLIVDGLKATQVYDCRLDARKQMQKELSYGR